MSPGGTEGTRRSRNLRLSRARPDTGPEEDDVNDATPTPEDDHVAAILRDRIAKDSGERYSLDAVIAMCGFDPHELSPDPPMRVPV